jgi:hypothetical protein
VLLLGVGAVLQQQLGRAQRVRHANQVGDRVAGGLQSRDHFGLRHGRQLEATVLARDDHAEEPFPLQEIHDMRRNLGPLGVQFPRFGHAAEFGDRAVEERTIAFGELGLAGAEQLLPVRLAGKQFAVPPHGAGVDRLFLGIGQTGQRLAVPAVQRRRQHGGPQRAEAERAEHQRGGAEHDHRSVHAGSDDGCHDRQAGEYHRTDGGAGASGSQQNTGDEQRNQSNHPAHVGTSWPQNIQIRSASYRQPHRVFWLSNKASIRSLFTDTKRKPAAGP